MVIPLRITSRSISHFKWPGCGGKFVCGWRGFRSQGCLKGDEGGGRRLHPPGRSATRIK